MCNLKFWLLRLCFSIPWLTKAHFADLNHPGAMFDNIVTWFKEAYGPVINKEKLWQIANNTSLLNDPKWLLENEGYLRSMEYLMCTVAGGIMALAIAGRILYHFCKKTAVVEHY